LRLCFSQRDPQPQVSVGGIRIERDGSSRNP